jgi:shikimate dehydrogenase
MARCRQAAVVGHPIRHSLSPLIFGFLSRQLKNRLIYHALDILPEDLRSSLRLCRELSFVGWNVTIPHKEAIIPYLSSLSAEAQQVGAVNVVRFNGHQAKGHNTDVTGLICTLSENNLQVRGKSVVVFGAGGAARAVSYGAAKKGAVRIYVKNRTFSRGEILCTKLQPSFPKTDFIPVKTLSQIEDQIYLYVNATPLGMEGFPLKSPLSSAFPSGLAAIDLVYKPRVTPFLEMAKRQGMKTIAGLDMLIWQAIGTWEIWFGRIHNRAELFSVLKRFLIRKL